jgi:hypothetical protein
MRVIVTIISCMWWVGTLSHAMLVTCGSRKGSRFYERFFCFVLLIDLLSVVMYIVVSW